MESETKPKLKPKPTTEIKAPTKYQTVPVPAAFTDFEDVYSEAVERASDGAKFVEIGAWLGKSAVLMAELIENSGKDIEFTTIDPFVVEPKWNDATQVYDFHRVHFTFQSRAKELYQKHLAEAGYQDKIKHITDYSEGASNQFEAESLDFVFIDGAHDYPNVKFDIHTWYEKVKQGGMIAGHDYEPQTNWANAGVVKAIREFAKAKNIRYTVSKNTFIIYK